MSVCPHCTAPTTAELRFCGQCGTSLSAVTQAFASEKDPWLGRVVDKRYRVAARIGTGGMRREADDVARFATASGDEFDRGFWVAVAQEQSAASDMLPSIAEGGPELTRLAAELGQVLDRSSLRALSIARAQQPAAKAKPASQVSPTR